MSYSDGRSSWQPETYAELGAAVPFTAPELTGARARRGKAGLELTLPNPAGKRGIYILDPREIGRTYAPTLHDRQLIVRLGRLADITPAAVRHAARATARAGLAGRHAAAAAVAAEDADRKAELATQLGLLRALVRQNAGQGGDAAQSHAADHAAIDGPAKRAIEALAARAGVGPAEISRTIGAVAKLVTPCGLHGGTEARHPALLERVAALETALTGLVPEDTGRAPRAANLVRAAAHETASLCRRALDHIWKRLADVPGLVTGSLPEPTSLAAITGQVDWLLDSWCQLCLVHQAAPSGQFRAALAEMALLAPCVPAEAFGWFAVTPQDATAPALRAELLGYADWRGGGIALDLTARNEHLRAVAA